MSRRVHMSDAKAVALVLVLTVGLVASSGTGAAALAAPVDASRSRAATLDAADPAKVAECEAQGFDQEDALFLALARVKAQAVGRHRVQITESFPTGNRAAITVTITPCTVATPAALNVQTHSSGGDLFFSLEYSVPSDAIPSDVEASMGLALADRSEVPVSLAAYAPAMGLLKAVKGGLSGVDAFTLKSELDALIAKLDALEKCAKNPTNPIDQEDLPEGSG